MRYIYLSLTYVLETTCILRASSLFDAGVLSTGPEAMDQFGQRLSDSDSDEDRDDVNYAAMLVCASTNSLVSPLLLSSMFHML